MPQRVYPINLVDFTGGLNLRGDAFELGEAESPDMLNVDLDQRGGFVARKGWTRWNAADITQLGTWDPRSMFVHELADGTNRVWLASNDLIGYSTSGSFTKMQIGGTDVVADAAPHGADFAAWGDDLYVACGRSNQSVVINSALAGTRLTAAAAGQWTAYATPSTTVMPKADYIAAHAGMMWVASTNEDGNPYRYRVRWSHFNNPGAWLETDYIDFKEGGGPITGLVPMADKLLVFCQSAVYAVYGYDTDSIQQVNITRERGAPHRQAIARSEGAVFFYSHPEGVYAISETDAEGSRFGSQVPTEISASLRPMFSSSDYAAAYEEAVWLGWVGQRLYFSCPYWTDGAATDARSTFVFDPTVGNGAWMLHRGSDGYGLGPFAQSGFGGGSQLKLACARSNEDVMKIDANDSPIDNFTGVNAGFDSFYVTKWLDGGYPTLKKRWRRPDLVMKERTLGYDVTIESYRDYDEANVARTKTVAVDAGGSGAIWGSFTWGDGTIYGPEAKGSRIERGGAFGSARAIQLRVSGQSQKPWGVDAIVLKFIPRRLR